MSVSLIPRDRSSGADGKKILQQTEGVKFSKWLQRFYYSSVKCMCDPLPECVPFGVCISLAEVH